VAKQTIDNGTVAGDGTGENLFDAFDKVNDNFNELYQKWLDLADTGTGKGASDVGVEDSAGNFASANVEAVIADLANGVDTLSATVVTVSTDQHTGDYSTIALAVAAISDAASSKPYVINILSGNHTNASAVTLPAYVSLQGSGQSTRLVTAGTNTIITTGWNRISDIHFEYTGGTANSSVRGPVYLQSSQNNGPVVLENCTFDVQITATDATASSGGRAAIRVGGSAGMAVIRDCTIVTESHGIDMPDNSTNAYVYDTNISLVSHGLTVDQTTSDGATHHIGINHEGLGRMYLFGGMITCGYGNANPNDDNANIYLYRTNNTSSHVFMYGCMGYARSDATTVGKVRCVYMEGEKGWARLFGCFFQAEDGANGVDVETIEAGYDPANNGKGKVELFASRVSSQTGHVFGMGSGYGLMQYDHNADGLTQDKYENGLCLADTDTASFTINLYSLSREGERAKFYNVGTSGNTLTLATVVDIDGQSSLVLEDGDYVSLLSKGGGSWLAENVLPSVTRRAQTIPHQTVSTSISLSFTATSGASSQLPANSRSVRLSAMSDCLVKFGDSSVAADAQTSLYMAAGTETFGIPSGATHIAVKGIGESGLVSVTGLDEKHKYTFTDNVVLPVGGGSASTMLPTGTYLRIFALTDCFIEFGGISVTADDDSIFFRAGTEFMLKPSTTFVAARRYAENGGLYISGAN
jgi:hypothetical protein